MGVVTLFKYGKRFRSAPSFNKKYVDEKRTYANKEGNLLNPYPLTVSLSISFNKLPWFTISMVSFTFSPTYLCLATYIDMYFPAVS